MHSPNSVESEICYLKFRHSRKLVWSFGLVLRNRSHTLWLCQNSWLVVLTVLKNISQWEGLSHRLWKKCSKPPTRKWSSRNSWISQKKLVMFHRFLYVYQAGYISFWTTSAPISSLCELRQLRHQTSGFFSAHVDYPRRNHIFHAL